MKKLRFLGLTCALLSASTVLAADQVAPEAAPAVAPAPATTSVEAAAPAVPVVQAVRQVESLPAAPHQHVSHAVMLRADNTLPAIVVALDPHGHKVPAPETNVSFVHGGNVVASGVSGADGRLILSTVQPGVWSVVAQGPRGFYATSVLVLPFNEATLDAVGKTESEISPVSFNQNGLPVVPELVIGPLMPIEDLIALQGPPALPPGFDGGMPFGAMGGPFGGGGGGGGFGGGFGNLFGLAGFGLGLAALLDDDDDDRRGRPNFPPPVSPVSP